MKKMTNYPIYDRQKTTQAAVSDCLNFYSSSPPEGRLGGVYYFTNTFLPPTMLIPFWRELIL